MSSTVNRLEMQSAMIANNRDSVEDVRYIPSLLIQCCLPQNNPGPIAVWKRYHQRTRILVHPWYDWSDEPHYPFGTFPRLLLYWVVWEAMQSGRREIRLGKSFSEFLRHFGVMNRNVRVTRYRDIIQQQMMSLFGCHIMFECKRKGQWQHIDFAPKGEIEWNTKVLGNRLTPESYILLGEAFFEEIKRRPVPVDMRAIHGLKHSALALDLYTWATYETFIQCTKPPAKTRHYSFTKWGELMYQLGANYAKTRQFKAKIPHVLEQVKAVYPELQADLLPEGIVIHASRPAVQIKERMPETIE
jgi:Plasmid encoded RepA protein